MSAILFNESKRPRNLSMGKAEKLKNKTPECWQTLELQPRGQVAFF